MIDAIEEDEILAEAYYTVDNEMLRKDFESGKENADPTSKFQSDAKASSFEPDSVSSDLVQEGTCSTENGKIKTLRDYIEGKPKKSPRGVDLELIKASPREEDLSKIKFARFVFDGVKTSVVSKAVKHIEKSEKDSAKQIDTVDPPIAIDDSQISEKAGSESREVLLFGTENQPGAHSSANPDDGAGGGGSADIERFRKLSNICIEQVGLQAVGQEYTRALKTVCKTIDIALRAGIGCARVRHARTRVCGFAFLYRGVAN